MAPWRAWFTSIYHLQIDALHKAKPMKLLPCGQNADAALLQGPHLRRYTINHLIKQLRKRTEHHLSYRITEHFERHQQTGEIANPVFTFPGV